ncbi:MAG: class I SAM-dependent methyltransferase [Dehalococcoidia bacterium]
MNKEHLVYCASPEWEETVRKYVVPGSTAGKELGDHLLEVGPGPGLTTNVLATMVPRLTAVELDEELAAALTERFAGTHVSIHRGDATRTPFADGTFSAAICLTMLHHLPTPEDQDRLFAELNRVVTKGGVVIGNDSLDSPEFRGFHHDDICTPVDPATLERRLRAAGLTDIEVSVNPFSVTFSGRAS